jgi:hypothetical protein
MKNLFLATLLLFTTITGNCALWMVCNGSQAYIYEVGSDGTMVTGSVVAAGPCAGGQWAIPLGIAPSGGCNELPCNASTSQQLHDYVVVDSEVELTRQELVTIQKLTDISSGATIILDPSILGEELTAFLMEYL